MRPHFLIIVPHAGLLSRDDHALANDVCRSTGMLIANAASSFIVLADAEMTRRTMTGGRGTVLGTVFERGGRGPLGNDHDHDRARSVLTSAHWGDYLALSHLGEGGPVKIQRSLSSTTPCYIYRAAAQTIITSNVSLLFDHQLLARDVNWPAVARHLLTTNLRGAETCQRGVDELLGGFELTLAGGEARLSPVWSPWAFAASERAVVDPAAATAMVRNAVLECTASWSGCFRKVLLSLSGGLDSSIVAAALGGAGHDFVALTLATAAAEGDERDYARAVAVKTGARLIEEFESADLIDVTHSDAGHIPRPIARSFAQSADRLSLCAAIEAGADAFFHGGGGDNVFCYLKSVTPIADRLLYEGPGWGAWRTAADIADLTGCSLWTTLTGGMRRALRRDRRYRWPVDTSFLSAGVRRHVPEVGCHPWLDAPRSALPGKAMHIAWILGIQNHLEGFNREQSYPVIAPLMAQPVIEACLQVPTWLWYRDGHNRYAARAAFVDKLPQSIAWRRSKGTPTSLIFELFDRHRSMIRDMLLDGCLAREQLIDRAALSAVFRPDHPVQTAECSRVMTLLDVETWARGWASG